MSELDNAALPLGDVRTTSGAMLGDGAVFIWNDIVASGLDPFYEWHDREHIPERLAIPGFCRGRRYVCPGHSPEWLTLYEAADLDVVVSTVYLERLNNPTPSTVDALRYFRNTSRAVCRIVHSIGSSSGGYVLALRVDVAAAQADAMKQYFCADVFPRMAALTSVVACHLYMADQPGSYLNTAESDTREFDVPAWIVLIETTRPQAAERARGLVDVHKLETLGAMVRPDGAVYSLEICRLPSPAAER